MKSLLAALLLSLGALSAAAGEIVLYERGRFQGRQVTLRGPVADLDHVAMRNEVSSLVVRSGSWELCTEPGYRGQCLTVNVGEYADLRQLNDRVGSVRERAAAGPRLPGGGYAPVGELVLYEHDDFQGRSLAVQGATADFEPLGFNDRTSSLVVRQGTWELCAHAHFAPPCRVFGPGEHRSVGAQWNDQFSSARPVGHQVPIAPGLPLASPVPTPAPVPGARSVDVILFEHANFEGGAKTLAAAVDNFESIDYNDAASSLIVLRGTWQFCSDAYFRGDCRAYGPGEYRTLPSGHNDRLSSARPGGDVQGSPIRGVAVTLYEYPDFAGRSHELNGPSANLESHRFNDRASSLVIEQGNWEFCTDANYRGDCRVLGPGRYRELPAGMDSRISSIRPR